MYNEFKFGNREMIVYIIISLPVAFEVIRLLGKRPVYAEIV